MDRLSLIACETQRSPYFSASGKGVQQFRRNNPLTPSNYTYGIDVSNSLRALRGDRLSLMIRSTRLRSFRPIAWRRRSVVWLRWRSKKSSVFMLFVFGTSRATSNSSSPRRSACVLFFQVSIFSNQILDNNKWCLLQCNASNYPVISYLLECTNRQKLTFQPIWRATA